VSSEELCILASWFLSPMSKNSVLEELRVRRLAVIQKDRFIRFCRAHYVTDRPTDDATGSVTIGGSYVCSTGMWSNNNCSICRLLDWFPCFCHGMEQGNRRQQTSLRPWCGNAC